MITPPCNCILLNLRPESIAEHAQKPLYTITSGELGTDIVTTDKQLRSAFRQAQEWNAILLLDEVDVFLAERNSVDLVQSAFVLSKPTQHRVRERPQVLTFLSLPPIHRI
jgi:hypothetical protein